MTLHHALASASVANAAAGCFTTLLPVRNIPDHWRLIASFLSKARALLGSCSNLAHESKRPPPSLPSYGRGRDVREPLELLPHPLRPASQFPDPPPHVRTRRSLLHPRAAEHPSYQPLIMIVLVIIVHDRSDDELVPWYCNG